MTLPEPPITYLITTGTATPENFQKNKKEILDVVTAAAENGISMVQLREKALPARLLFELAVDAVGIARSSTTRILINDRADIALAAGADGVHLASNSLAPDVVRRTFPGLLVGVSTHTIEETLAAAVAGSDFACFGPVFDTPGKGPVLGPERLAVVCRDVRPFPVIALGGIDQGNYQEVLSAGASGFAAIRFLNDPENMKLVNTKGNS